jgi:hypothetical protein
MYTQPPLVESPAASSKTFRQSSHKARSKLLLAQSTAVQTNTMANDDQGRYADTTNAETPTIQSSVSTLFSLRDDVLYPLQTSPSDLAQSPYMDMVETNFTPSTPSGFGTQDHELQLRSCSPVKILASPGAGSDLNCIGSVPLKSHGLNSGLVSRSLSGSPPKVDSVTELVKAQKRTASGEIKPATSPSHLSPRKPTTRSHSRTMSIDSNGNRIAEVSTS